LVTKTSVNIVNSVFVGNYASNSGGAIYGANCNLNLANCTITNNDVSLYSGGVHLTASSALTIQNSILWNNSKGSLLIGSIPYLGDVNSTNFSITYTSSTCLIPGEKNITGDPQFVSINNPKGPDFLFGTIDDGLMLSQGSNCIRAGSITNDPPEDILGFNRSTQEPSDLGAYLFQAVNSNVLGKYDDNGAFIPTASFTVIDGLKSELSIVLSLQKGYHRLIQVQLPKDEYTDRKNNIIVQVVALTSDNVSIGHPVNVKLYRVGQSQLFRSHYWSNGTLVGKPILFTNNSAMAGEHRYAYVVEGLDRCKIKIALDESQFN